MEMVRKKEYDYLYEDRNTYQEATERLYELLKVLRKECPWDREQNHESLRRDMIEEAYEAVEAIDNSDMKNLKEELGDVMLQVLFHSLLGEEEKEFDLAGVINDECNKMITRHPHVFLTEDPNNQVKSIDKVLEKWENIKVVEKNEKSATMRMERVPKALPALIRAQKVQKKASGVGFDWDSAEGPLAKVEEEIRELMAECGRENTDMNAVEEEFGDVLFSLVNLARFIKVDSENALKISTDKFIRRFSYVESKAISGGRELEDMTLEEMDKLWNEAKDKDL